MVLPYWVLEECKKRKKQSDFADLPVYEIVLRYIDQQGRLRYETKRLGPDMKLSSRNIANLVVDIEDRTGQEVRKTSDGWFESDATNYRYKAKFDDSGELIAYVPDETPFRSTYVEYDHHE